MRIACILIPHFPVAVERADNPSLRERSVIIGDTADGRKMVLDCSPEVEAQGVRASMPLRKALALCSEAIFLMPNPSRYRDVADAILDTLETISPEVEEREQGHAYLNAEGLTGHYREELDLGEAIIRSVRVASDLEASVGIAEGKFPAWAAAITSSASEVCVVPRSKEQEFLAPLDISLLPCDFDTMRRLGLLGLRGIGDFAALPLGPVQAQFGGEGHRLWKLVQGRDTEPLRPHRLEERLTERLPFPEPAATQEALLVGCRRLLARLHSRLQGRSARRMRLRAELWGGRSWERAIVFREPTGDWGRMLFITKSVLDGVHLPGPVEELGIELSGLVGEKGKQLTMFSEKTGLRPQLGETLRQLRERWGRPLVSHVVEVEPRSRIPERRHALIDYDP